MPYKLKKVKGGWQVTSPNHPGGFKKTPHKSKEKAIDQLAALKIHTDESIKTIKDLLEAHEHLNRRTPTEEELAEKYGVDISTVREAVRIGTRVEIKDHTTDPEIAREIAMDHLGERLDYYNKLTV